MDGVRTKGGHGNVHVNGDRDGDEDVLALVLVAVAVPVLVPVTGSVAETGFAGAGNCQFCFLSGRPPCGRPSSVRAVLGGTAGKENWDEWTV